MFSKKELTAFCIFIILTCEVLFTLWLGKNHDEGYALIFIIAMWNINQWCYDFIKGDV